MSKEEFELYVEENFASERGAFLRLLTNTLDFVEQRFPEEERHERLWELLEGTIGLTKEEVDQIRF